MGKLRRYRNELFLQSEVEVYETGMRWINQNRPNRVTHLDALMNCVRWLYVSTEELIEIKRLDPLIFSDPIVSSKAAMGQWQRDLLRRGITSTNAPDIPLNRVEQTQLRQIILSGQNR